MVIARSLLSMTLLLLIAAPADGQIAPAPAQAALGNRIQFSGRIMQQDPAGEGLHEWRNIADHRLEVRVTDSSGDAHVLVRGSAAGGQLNLEVTSPASELLLPVADYASEISAIFSGSFFGPIPMAPAVSNNRARIQRFGRLEVRTAEDRSAGFVQRWRKEPASTMQLSWLFADRDVNISGRASAPGVVGEVDLRLKQGWNAVLLTLIYERGRDGRLLLRTSSRLPSMQWIYWELGG